LEGVPTRARPAAVRPVQRLAQMFGSTGVRLGAVAAVLTVFGVTSIVVLKGGAGEGDASAAAGDDPRLQGSTTTTAHTSTSTSSTTTSTSSTTSTTVAPTTTTSLPTTTTSPPTTEAPAPPPPPATNPPPVPEISAFWGFYMGGGDCDRGEWSLSLWWDTDNATSARIRPDGGDWIPAEVPEGSTRVCSEGGTRWTIEASNSSGTESSSFEP
jgi:hypothetical protein